MHMEWERLDLWMMFCIVPPLNQFCFFVLPMEPVRYQPHIVLWHRLYILISRRLPSVIIAFARRNPSPSVSLFLRMLKDSTMGDKVRRRMLSSIHCRMGNQDTPSSILRRSVALLYIWKIADHSK